MLYQTIFPLSLPESLSYLPSFITPEIYRASFYFLQIPSLIAWWCCLEKWMSYSSKNYEGGMIGGLLRWKRPPAQAGTSEKVGNDKSWTWTLRSRSCSAWTRSEGRSLDTGGCPSRTGCWWVWSWRSRSTSLECAEELLRTIYCKWSWNLPEFNELWALSLSFQIGPRLLSLSKS